MGTAAATPYDELGEATTLALAARFYDLMELEEPALARLHPLAADSTPARLRIEARVRERFGLFLVGWLGGPQTYHERHGHPRLRMRHAHVRVDANGRDAWLRCMFRAMHDVQVPEHVRTYLEQRFAEVAEFLRNDGTGAK
jgi:hemoglobin